MRRTYTSNADFEFQDIEIENRIYDVSFSAIGNFENLGIGHLEAWGKPIYDEHYGIGEYEIDDMLVEEQIDDGEVREIHDKDIIQKVCEWISDNKTEEIIKKLEEDRGEEDEHG